MKLDVIRREHAEIVAPASGPTLSGVLLPERRVGTNQNSQVHLKGEDSFVVQIVELIRFIVESLKENQSFEINFDNLIGLIKNRLNLTQGNMSSQFGHDSE